jgi:hypothetical protein
MNRIFGQLHKQGFFPLKTMTNFGTFYVFILFALYFYFFNRPFWFWFTTFLTLFFIPIATFFIVRFHQHQFHGEFLRFLSMVILAMKRGLSFSAAMEVSLRGNSWKQDQLLKSLYENVVFSQQEPVAKKGRFGELIRQIHLEFRSLHQDSHLAIDRLCNFRKTLHERIIFRQKSRQIWFYFAFQLGLLSLIYSALLIFVLLQNGFSRYPEPYYLSFILYFAGVIFTIVIARRKQWPI